MKGVRVGRMTALTKPDGVVRGIVVGDEFGRNGMRHQSTKVSNKTVGAEALVARTVRGLWPADPQTTSLPLTTCRQPPEREPPNKPRPRQLPVRLFAMDLAYMCVKPQMRLYVCQALPLPNTKCVYMCVTKCVYMCVTKCVYMCVTKCVYMCVTKCVHMCVTKCVHMCVTNSQRSSLRSLTFARFARTFFNNLNKNSCLKNFLVQTLILV